jgi:iron(III) transport system permease protein
VVVGTVVGVPLVVPFLGLGSSAAGWSIWEDPGRLAALAGNTLALATHTLALALPVGTAGAVLLYRTDLPGRALLRFLLLLSLFVPLPLLATAWQAAWGAGGWLPEIVGAATPPGAWAPWAEGIGAAAWIHAVAAVPWVVLIVGLGLGWVERELEEDALTAAGPWRVLCHVTLPRCRAALAAAGLWVLLGALTEITVTDVTQVRTFAEETYTQMVLGDRPALDRAASAQVPVVALAAALLLGTARGVERRLPPLEYAAVMPLVFPLRRARWPLAALTWLAVAAVALLPVAGLLWKAGLSGAPATWSLRTVGAHLVRPRGALLAESLGTAAAAGVLLAGAALVVCWLAVGSRWFRIAAAGLVALAWVVPAPLVGFGLAETIRGAVGASHFPLLARLLYYGPSPVPVVWAYLVRFFPYACAMLWPVIRLIPRELVETARLEGARPRQVLTRVALPIALPACLVSALATGVLALGELGASKRVATAGTPVLAHEVFEQMHYGVTNDLAALCLLLLIVVAVGGAGVGVLMRTAAQGN